MQAYFRECGGKQEVGQVLEFSFFNVIWKIRGKDLERRIISSVFTYSELKF